MKTKNTIFIGVLGLFMMSCASYYKPIRPDTLNYSNKQISNEKLEVSYMYDVYSISDNRKYSRKEKNNNYRTIAVRIRNLTDTTRIITTDNFRIFANERELTVANKTAYFSTVYQMPEVYLLHGLWGPWRVDSWSDSNGKSGSKTTYIPIGITIGVINVIVASAANSNHKKNLNNNEIFGRTIKPNGTITGIIILNYSQYDPLDFKYLDK